MKPGLYFDVPPDVYHSDPMPQPSLSASIAHTLVSRSPLHAWLQHPRLGGRPKKVTRAMDNGSLCHAILLGTGKEYRVVEGFDDWRKSAAQARRKEIESEGRIALLQKDFDAAHALSEQVRAGMKRFGIELSGRSEVTVVWDEVTDHGEAVRCRGQMDHLIESDGQIWDLKFVRSAHPKACQSHIVSFGGDIQATAYERGLVAHRPALAGRVRFGFLFCEVETGIVTPVTLAGSMRDLGRSRWERAVKTWAQCLATDTWPAYVAGLTQIEAPAWAHMAESDAQLSEDWSSPAASDGPISGGARPEPGASNDHEWDGDDSALF